MVLGTRIVAGLLASVMLGGGSWAYSEGTGSGEPSDKASPNFQKETQTVSSGNQTCDPGHGGGHHHGNDTTGPPKNESNPGKIYFTPPSQNGSVLPGGQITYTFQLNRVGGDAPATISVNASSTGDWGTYVYPTMIRMNGTSNAVVRVTVTAPLVDTDLTGWTSIKAKALDTPGLFATATAETRIGVI